MNPAIRIPLLASCLLLSATLGNAQAPTLTAEQEALLKARIAELEKQRGSGGAAAAGMPAPTATPASRIAGTIEATLLGISENRSMSQGRGNASLNFTFTFSAPGLDASASVRRVQVNRVIDNLDRPLAAQAGRGGVVVGGTVNQAIQQMNSGRGGAAAALGLRGTASMQGGPRDVSSLKLIEGEVDVYVSTPDNGSQARIPNVGSMVGKSLEHPSFKAAGMEVMLVDKERYATLGFPVQPGMPELDFTGTAWIYVRDPGSRLVSLVLQDEAGVPLGAQPGGSRNSGVGIIYGLRPLSGSLPPSAQLVVYVAVPEALKTYTFKLENVQMP